MLQTKRKKKKNLKRKTIIVFTVLLLASAVFGYFFYIKKYNKPLFINPLSKDFSFTDSAGKDVKINVIKAGLEKDNIHPDKISSTNGVYIAEMSDKSIIIFSNSKDISSQLASLQFILTRLTMEGKLFTRL